VNARDRYAEPDHVLERPRQPHDRGTHASSRIFMTLV
jgi:hypothetical protein